MTIVRFATVAFGFASLAPASLGQAELWHARGAANECFGVSLARVGDVDGDGIADLVATGWFPAPTATGVVVLSGRDGSRLHALPSPAPPGSGSFVARAGDLDLDGVDDVAIARVATGGNGLIRIHSAATGALLLTLAPTPGVSTETQFGDSFDAAGDFDGDGREDYLVGEYVPKSSTTHIGRVELRSGATGGALWTLLEPASSEGFGWAVAGAGDFDLDGALDAVVGSPLAGDFAGVVTVHSGANGAVLKKFGPTGAFGLAGSSVDGAEDVDQDGVPDVLYTAPNELSGGVLGTVRVHSGKTGALLLAAHAGSPLRRARYTDDFDGDGLPDVLVTEAHTPLPGAGSDSAGAARVISSAGGSVLALVAGSHPDDQAGIACEVLDADGDGAPDLVVGFPQFAVDYDALAIVPEGPGVVRAISSRCGPIATAGAPCAGTVGFAPHLEVVGCASPGGALHLHTTGNPSYVKLFLVGLPTAGSPLPGGCSTFVAHPYLVFGEDAGSAIPLALPLGTTFAAQGLVLATGGKVAATEAVTVTLD